MIVKSLHDVIDYNLKYLLEESDSTLNKRPLFEVKLLLDVRSLGQLSSISPLHFVACRSSVRSNTRLCQRQWSVRHRRDTRRQYLSAISDGHTFSRIFGSDGLSSK